MDRNQKIAVVILNWNGEKLFRKFLPSVIQHSKGENIEVIVADNGSTDNSIGCLKADFPSVKIIRLEKNYGFAEGYNQALMQVDADIYVLLNSDVEVTEGWIESCMDLFEKKSNAAVIQPKILSYGYKDKFEYAGAAGGFIDRFGYPFCRGRILNRTEKDEGQYNQATPVFWASGACMFISADVFHKTGGFDGDFWAHMEEIDLCWRIKSIGYEVWYQPLSTVYHLGGGTLSYQSPRKVYLNFRNNLFMLYKNLPDKYFKRIMTIRLVLDGVAAVKFLVQGYFTSFMAVANAHSAFYRHLQSLKRKRKQVQAQSTVQEHAEIYPKSIMWKFFIQKKRDYPSLNFKPEK